MLSCRLMTFERLVPGVAAMPRASRTTARASPRVTWSAHFHLPQATSFHCTDAEKTVAGSLVQGTFLAIVL